uniref:Putative secreted protein n=1 Tax=Ixodes ricinus TaxID=34613 RepID=A0A6B0V5D6_IXORI
MEVSQTAAAVAAAVAWTPLGGVHGTPEEAPDAVAVVAAFLRPSRSADFLSLLLATLFFATGSRPVVGLRGYGCARGEPGDVGAERHAGLTGLNPPLRVLGGAAAAAAASAAGGTGLLDTLEQLGLMLRGATTPASRAGRSAGLSSLDATTGPRPGPGPGPTPGPGPGPSVTGGVGAPLGVPVRSAGAPQGSRRRQLFTRSLARRASCSLLVFLRSSLM